jgi:Transposase DDE domain.
MGILKRLQRSVEKITSRARLSDDEARLANDLVIGMSQSQSVLLSQIGRALGEKEPLLTTERRLSEGLAEDASGLDRMQQAWLDEVAPTARRMPFITVDGSDVTKPYGKAFQYLDWVRDGSVPGKPTKPGYWDVSIEGTDGHHHHLPLWYDVYSTKDPAYLGWTETFQQAVRRVVAAIGAGARWLFDRGFDDVVFMAFLVSLHLAWVIRLRSNRNVLLGDPKKPVVMNIGQLAQGLKKPHTAVIEYVDKSTHKRKTCQVFFGYVPLRLPDLEGTYWLVVVTGTRGDDWLLLTNKAPSCVKEAEGIVHAYLQRWGNEEVTRCWKQCTGAEKFLVRKMCSIRRLLFHATMAMGIQALWLLTRPQSVQKLIRRVKVFIKDVPFLHYRLWYGVSDALLRGS